jgi:hypothetical protein
MVSATSSPLLVVLSSVSIISMVHFRTGIVPGLVQPEQAIAIAPGVSVPNLSAS